MKNKVFICLGLLSLVVLCIMVGVFFITVCDLNSHISQLEIEKKQLEEYISQLEKEIQYENVELDSCPMCGGIAELEQVNDSFYIECTNCELRTTFFKSKADLIMYWNNN